MMNNFGDLMKSVEKILFCPKSVKNRWNRSKID